jgi:hypothetical protein
VVVFELSMNLPEILTPVGIAVGSVATLLDILLARGSTAAPEPSLLEVFDEVRLPGGLTVLQLLEAEGFVVVERWDDGKIQRLAKRTNEWRIVERAAEILTAAKE